MNLPRSYAVRIGRWHSSPTKHWKRAMAATPARAVELVLQHHDHLTRRLARRVSQTEAQVIESPDLPPRMPCLMETFTVRLKLTPSTP